MNALLRGTVTETTGCQSDDDAVSMARYENVASETSIRLLPQWRECMPRFRACQRQRRRFLELVEPAAGKSATETTFSTDEGVVKPHKVQLFRDLMQHPTGSG